MQPSASSRRSKEQGEFKIKYFRENSVESTLFSLISLNSLISLSSLISLKPSYTSPLPHLYYIIGEGNPLIHHHSDSNISQYSSILYQICNIDKIAHFGAQRPKLYPIPQKSRATLPENEKKHRPNYGNKYQKSLLL